MHIILLFCIRVYNDGTYKNRNVHNLIIHIYVAANVQNQLIEEKRKSMRHFMRNFMGMRHFMRHLVKDQLFFIFNRSSAENL